MVSHPATIDITYEVLLTYLSISYGSNNYRVCNRSAKLFHEIERQSWFVS
jgi:hypothetical protein